MPAIVETAEFEYPPAIPAHLTEGDREHHAYIIQQCDQLRQLAEQVAALEARAAVIGGARDSWVAFLGQKYHLAEGDQIQADGTIIRRVVPHPDTNGTGQA